MISTLAEEDENFSKMDYGEEWIRSEEMETRIETTHAQSILLKKKSGGMGQ